MDRSSNTVKMLAMAFVVITLLAVLTPVCSMPTCDGSAAVACSDFQPACDECPTPVVMKHTHDEATAIIVPDLPEPSATGTLPAATAFEPVALVLRTPEATASPPPLDPLGVRLTV